MTRRGFIGSLAAAIAGATLDPELALWRPGKLISIPRPSANYFLTGDEITRQVLLVLSKNMVAVKDINRQYAKFRYDILPKFRVPADTRVRIAS